MQTLNFSFESQKFSFWVVFPFEPAYEFSLCAYLWQPKLNLFIYSFIYSKYVLRTYYVLSSILGFFVGKKMIVNYNSKGGVVRKHISYEMTFRLSPEEWKQSFIGRVECRHFQEEGRIHVKFLSCMEMGTTGGMGWKVLEGLAEICICGTLEALMRKVDIIQYVKKTNGNIVDRKITWFYVTRNA